jgi:hypothetical protein
MAMNPLKELRAFCFGTWAFPIAGIRTIVEEFLGLEYVGKLDKHALGNNSSSTTGKTANETEVFYAQLTD